MAAANAGDGNAAERLLPLVYDELRRLAAARLRKAAPGQTLQATALVHEAYLRLVDERHVQWANRAHFFFAAARAMRDILVERARRKAALKRGGNRRRVDAGRDTQMGEVVERIVAAMDTPPEDLLALDDALAELERDDPDASRLVMLRFFAGLTEAQTAEALGVTDRTVRREWRYARARLHAMLSDGREAFVQRFDHD